MRDGAHRVGDLGTRVTLPDSSPRAVLVVRTPYGADAHRAEGAAWAARGVAFVVQDVRGRHTSPGDFAPYAGEGPDGLALLTWVRSWTAAPVVLQGSSYGAHCALATLDAAAGTPGAPTPDAVALAVPAPGLGETARTPDGAFLLQSRLGWWTEHAHTPTPSPVPAALPGLWQRLPVTTAGDHAPRPVPSWRRVTAARRTDDERARLLAAQTCPLLVVGGTADWFAREAVRTWADWGGPARLVLGPWDHGLRGASRAAVTLDWLDAVGHGRPPEGALVVDGRGAQRELGSWPAAVRGTVLAGGVVHADARHPRPSPPLGSRTLAPGPRADQLVLPVPPAAVDPGGGLTGDVTVTVRADGPGHWCASLALRGPGGALQELAHGGSTGPRVRLGPVVVPPADGGDLVLVVSPHDFPRHARDLQSGADHLTGTGPAPARRTVHAVEMETPA